MSRICLHRLASLGLCRKIHLRNYTALTTHFLSGHSKITFSRSRNNEDFFKAQKKFYSNSLSVVLNKDTEKKFVELYKDLKTMDLEQILELSRNQGLTFDPIHIAMCMKRIHALFLESDEQEAFIEELHQDFRFKNLEVYLMVSARDMAPTMIADMLSFSMRLRCELPYLYGLLRLCTNVVSDLSLSQMSQLTAILCDLVSDLDEGLRDKSLSALHPEQSGWSVMMSNQVELLFNSIFALVGSKEHQIHGLDLVSGSNLLFAFGAELPFLHKLLRSIQKNLDVPSDLFISELVPRPTRPSLTLYEPKELSDKESITDNITPMHEKFFASIEKDLESRSDLLLSKLLPALLRCSTSLASCHQETNQRLQSALAIQVESLKANLRKNPTSSTDVKLFEKINIVNGDTRAIESGSATSKTMLDLKRKVSVQNTVDNLLLALLEEVAAMENEMSLSKDSLITFFSACSAYLDRCPEGKGKNAVRKKCMEVFKSFSDNLVHEVLSGDSVCNWTFGDFVHVISCFGGVGYYPRLLAEIVADSLEEEAAGSLVESPDDSVVNLRSILENMNDKDRLDLIEILTMYELINSKKTKEEESSSLSSSDATANHLNSSPILGSIFKFIRDHEFDTAGHVLSGDDRCKASLGVRMKLLSYILISDLAKEANENENMEEVTRRKIRTIYKEIADIIDDDDAVTIDDELFDTTRLFFQVISRCGYSDVVNCDKLENHLVARSRKGHKAIDLMVNKLWKSHHAGVVVSPGVLCDYIINLQNKDGTNQKVILNIMSDNNFWRNTTQIKPLYYVATTTDLLPSSREYRFVLFNEKKFLQIPERERMKYLKYRVEEPNRFSDLLNII